MLDFPGFCATPCRFRALCQLLIACALAGCGAAVAPGASPDASSGCPSVDAINHGTALGTACSPEGAYCTDESCDACDSSCPAIGCVHGVWRTAINTALCTSVDGGVAGEDAGDANVCMNLDATGLDRSCESDADCVPVAGGTYCTDGTVCFCAADTINARDRDAFEARYQAALARIGDAAGRGCHCPFFGSPRCVANRCVLCGGASSDALCPDGG